MATTDTGAHARRYSSATLILANVIPLLGVILANWSVGHIIFLYWIESAVIGLLNVARMVVIGRLSSIPIVVFFTLHYGLFMTVHLAFIVALFFGADESLGAALAEALEQGHVTALAATSFLVSHGISFWINFIGQQEYARRSLDEQMFAPYKRIVVMHLTILFGGWLAVAIGAPIGALILMVVLKTIIDLVVHIRAHANKA